MVMGESSCRRSGTDRRGGVERSGSGRGGGAGSAPWGPTVAARSFAEGQATSMGGRITPALCLGCFCGLIAWLLLVLLGPLLSLYAADCFTGSQPSCDRPINPAGKIAALVDTP